MREYFGDPDEPELPPPLAQWLESGSPTLARRLDDRRLTVERSTDALLLKETRDELGLTPRERQILAWVARGKTNPEIAQILWVAPSTVRKHLENVYQESASAVPNGRPRSRTNAAAAVRVWTPSFA
jgi:DNA-binding CsgD family transcriptional regulator